MQQALVSLLNALLCLLRIQRVVFSSRPLELGVGFFVLSEAWGAWRSPSCPLWTGDLFPSCSWERVEGSHVIFQVWEAVKWECTRTQAGMEWQA